MKNLTEEIDWEAIKGEGRISPQVMYREIEAGISAEEELLENLKRISEAFRKSFLEEIETDNLHGR
jgi:hypothetical protein